MTDIRDDLLSSMSNTFNANTDTVDINLNEDKTRKWKGLLNNKSASNRQRKDGGVSAVAAAEDALVTSATPVEDTKIDFKVPKTEETEDARHLITTTNLSPQSVQEQALSQEQQQLSVDNKSAASGSVDNAKADKPKRVLRRKAQITMAEGERVAAATNKKSKSTEIFDDTIGDISIKENGTDNIAVDPNTIKTPFKRRGRARKIALKVTEIPSESKIRVDQADKSYSKSASRLRRSERTQQAFGYIAPDNVESPTQQEIVTVSASIQTLEKDSKPQIESEQPPSTSTDVSKRGKKKILDVMLEDATTTKNKIGQVQTMEVPEKLSPPEKAAEMSDPEDSKDLIEILPTEVLDVVKIEDSPTETALPDTVLILATPEVAEAGHIEAAMNTPLPEIRIPKRRGRKPGYRKPSVPMEGGNINSAKVVKKSPRNSKDELPPIVISQASKNTDKLQPGQRLSRRIKPTAKILANEELRYGFELQNNARLSLSSEHLDKEIDRSPPKDLDPNNKTVETTVVDIIVKNEKDAAAAQYATASSLQISLADEIVPRNTSPPPQCPVVVSPLRRRPPCIDPEEFLNAIKMEKINLNRSPEDNKKLNVKQMKRLSKLKEQHFKRLGLQRRHTNRSNSDSSAVESAESDDQEEFVPNKKIKVGRPSVTLRVRNNRELVREKVIPLVVKKPQRNAVSLSPTNKKNTGSESPTKSISSNITVPEPMSRCHENSLILSTKHKAQTERSTGAVGNDAPEDDRLAKEDLDDTICLCTKPSKYYTEKSTDTRYCRAVDEIESQLVGCCNETDGSGLLNLLRSSVRVSYMILCRNHKERLAAHHCCAGCGVFCTQGAFILCARNHLFHRNCATKFILNAPFNPRNPNVYECPTLVLKCPHCGSDAPERESRITMSCRTIPVFQPNQLFHRTAVKRQPAKMSIGQHRTFSGSAFPLDMAKLMPTPVADVLVRAQRTFPFSVPSKFSYRDLLCAITKNDIERFAEIIVSGFDITKPQVNGTCLHLVANFGSISMAYLILSRAPTVDFVNAIDSELRTAIMYAIAGEKNDILKLLVQCGGDVTLKGANGMTALHLAAKNGNFEAAQIILDNYLHAATANRFETFLNAVDDGGWTAIVWAAEIGHADMVSYFITRGADINVCDAENNTVLHWAALSDNVETIVALVQTNCDFNMQNINGDTPLHIACRHSNSRICLLLLAHGASLELKNGNGESAYDCVPDEQSPCGRAIQFNAQLRNLAQLDDRNIVCQDISNGRERYPIKVVKSRKPRTKSIEDDIDNHSLPDFKYICKSILLQNSIQIDQRISQMRICACSDNCTTDSCQCSEISVQNWYNVEGRLNGSFNFQDPAMIFECNDVCGCNKLLCKNRVVQNGLRVALQIVECPIKAKGWGVRALGRIVKGTFVVQYTGEILTDVEADRRTDDSYFFDLGSSDHCIDANYYGNVSRFFNHSCDPNVVPIRVYFEHQDLRFPKIAFFACRDIEPTEEITFNYGDKFWLIKYKLFRCKCGSPACRFSDQTINKTLDEIYQRSNAAATPNNHTNHH